MPDMSAIAGAVASLKALKDIVQGAIAFRDQRAFAAHRAEITNAIIDAQSAVLQMQDEHAKLTNRIRELEAAIAQLQDWHRERERYALTEIASRVLAYTLKPDFAAGEPAHMLCARCYQHGEKSILQGQNSHFQGWLYSCPTCGRGFED